MTDATEAQLAVKKLHIALGGTIIFQRELIEALSPPDDEDAQNWINRANIRLDEATLAMKETERFLP